MNIILLILGAFLIIFSIVKIILSLNNREAEDRDEIKEEELEKNIIHEEELEDELEQSLEESFLEENFIEEKDYIEEKPDFEEKYIDVIDTSDNKSNMTEKIISMHKEGLTVNQIAKRLKKGVREIEIILKINKIE